MKFKSLQLHMHLSLKFSSTLYPLLSEVLQVTWMGKEQGPEIPQELRGRI